MVAAGGLRILCVAHVQEGVLEDIGKPYCVCDVEGEATPRRPLAPLGEWGSEVKQAWAVIYFSRYPSGKIEDRWPWVLYKSKAEATTSMKASFHLHRIVRVRIVDVQRKPPARGRAGAKARRAR